MDGAGDWECLAGLEPCAPFRLVICFGNSGRSNPLAEQELRFTEVGPRIPLRTTRPGVVVLNANPFTEGIANLGAQMIAERHRDPPVATHHLQLPPQACPPARLAPCPRGVGFRRRSQLSNAGHRDLSRPARRTTPRAKAPPPALASPPPRRGCTECPAASSTACGRRPLDGARGAWLQTRSPEQGCLTGFAGC